MQKKNSSTVAIVSAAAYGISLVIVIIYAVYAVQLMHISKMNIDALLSVVAFMVSVVSAYGIAYAVKQHQRHYSKE